MSVLIFLLVLFVLVLVHEWGHFIVAKKTGMRVDEFGIGFPPRLFGWRWGETLYSLNIFPIGGFVKIWGEDGTDAPSSPVLSKGEKSDAKLAAETGLGGAQAEHSKLSAAERERAFGARPKWAQALVLIAGVVMNIVFAWLLIVVVQMIGVPTAVDEQAAGPTAELMVTDVLPDGPAAMAGLPIQSVIQSVSDGESTITNPLPSTFSEFVQARPNRPLTVVWQDNAGSYTTTLTPRSSVIENDTETVAVGVALTMVEVQNNHLFAAIQQGTVMTVTMLRDITIGLIGLLAGAFTGEADLSQVAGPVGIVGLVGEAAAFGLTTLLMFTAVISLNLAVINLLPFPALDGGRLVMVGIEAMTRRPLSSVWVSYINLAGFVILILLMLAVTYSDVSKLL